MRDEFPTGKLRGERFEHFTKDQWEASNYAKPEAMQRWQDLRYGMFIHFGITSRAKRDLSWGSIARRYAPNTPSIMADGQPRTEEWTTWGNDMKLEKSFHTDHEAAPFVDIDLGGSVKVTGVFIRNANPENAGNRMATLRASVSLDGREWTEVWRAAASEPSWEFPITSFVSGARIPGRQARFLRLQVHPSPPGPLLLKQVEVYGK